MLTSPKTSGRRPGACVLSSNTETSQGSTQQGTTLNARMLSRSPEHSPALTLTTLSIPSFLTTTLYLAFHLTLPTHCAHFLISSFSSNASTLNSSFANSSFVAILCTKL